MGPDQACLGPYGPYGPNVATELEAALAADLSGGLVGRSPSVIHPGGWLGVMGQYYE